MCKIILKVVAFLMGCQMSLAQVTTSPHPPLADGVVTIHFDKANTGLANYSGIIYAHIGLTVNGQSWQYVKGSWGDNSAQPALSFEAGTSYSLTLAPDLYSFFNVPSSEAINAIDVVFRSADGTQ